MKIVKREAFLQLPAGTVYFEYRAHNGTSLCVKTSDPGEFENDFCYQPISALEIEAGGSIDLSEKMDDMVDNGTEAPLVFDGSGRDGMFDDSQLFAVLDDADVQELVDTLTKKWKTTDRTKETR